MLDGYINQERMHPSRNTHTPEKYLAGLESNDASRLFYEGQKYTQTSFNKFLMGWNIYGYYQELRNFYPYTPAVTKAADLYVSDMTESVQTGLAISAASIFTIYQMARRGYVVPVLRQYGRFFKTHRVFRQYAWALVLPTTILATLVDLKHLDNVSELWATHSRRMNAQLLADPTSSVLPKELQGVDMAGVWQSDFMYWLDYPKKVSNEVVLSEAPDYANPEFEAVQLPESEGAADEDEDEEE